MKLPLTLALIGLIGIPAARAANPLPPNFIVINVDDLGYHFAHARHPRIFG